MAEKTMGAGDTRTETEWQRDVALTAVKKVAYWVFETQQMNVFDERVVWEFIRALDLLKIDPESAEWDEFCKWMKGMERPVKLLEKGIESWAQAQL